MPPTSRSRKFSQIFVAKKIISLTVRTSRRVWEVVDSLSKFQSATTLGDLQNVSVSINSVWRKKWWRGHSWKTNYQKSLRATLANRSNRKNEKCHLWRNSAERPAILLNGNPIQKILGTFGLIPSKVVFLIFAKFWRIKPNVWRIKPKVPGNFRIEIRFERISGRSA